MSNEIKPFDLNELLAQDIANAVKRSLSETFGVETVVGEVEYGDGIVALAGDISGIIGIVQSQLEGTLMLSMSSESVRDILPQIVGKSVAITHEMAVDAVSELTNMIFGQVKSDWNQRGLQIKLGIPCVVSGKGHFVSQFHRGRYMIVPFHVGGKLLQVYLAVHDGAGKR